MAALGLDEADARQSPRGKRNGRLDEVTRKLLRVPPTIKPFPIAKPDKPLAP